MHSGQAACRILCSILMMLTIALPARPVGFRTIALPRTKRSNRSPISLANAMNLRTWRIPGTPASRRSQRTRSVMSGLRAKLSSSSLAFVNTSSSRSSVMDLLAKRTSSRELLPRSAKRSVAKDASRSIGDSIGGHSGQRSLRVNSHLLSALRQSPSGGRLPLPCAASAVLALAEGTAMQLPPACFPGLWSCTIQPLGPRSSMCLTFDVWQGAILERRHRPSPQAE
mmetsp:Transcript_51070/g.145795  ORF Transcript_51070/g.145795 Transcript_51070/m.145795 type:complete len:226 (+) Transcript_51070:706-1383(+)